MALREIEVLLNQSYSEDLLSRILQWSREASLDDYTRYTHLVLLGLQNGESKHMQLCQNVMTQEAHSNLRQPSRINALVDALVSNEANLKDFDIFLFASQHSFAQDQLAMLAVEVLYRISEPADKVDAASRALRNNLEALSRFIGMTSVSETTPAQDIATMVRKVLLHGPCADLLKPVQRFVLEYAIFQHYSNELPHEIAHFFKDYNQSRAQDDASKSLAQLFDETRGAATNTLTAVKQLLERGRITSQTDDPETQIATLIITLVTSGHSPGIWNGDKLAKGICDVIPDLRWNRIVRDLDRDNFEIGSMNEFVLLMSIFRGAMSTGTQNIGLEYFWSTWRNTRAQASLLRHLTQAPLTSFNINEYAGPTVLSADDFVAAQPALKNLAAELETSPWNSLELLQTSLRLLSDDAAASETKHFLEAAGKTTPELIFLGCIQLPRPWGPQQEQLSEKGCEVFFGGQPHHQLVFYRLWQVDPEFLCRKFVEYHGKDSLSVSRILDIAQDLQILDQLLNLQPFAFAIDLAALAAKMDLLNIEKWLDHHISIGQDNFIESCLRFLAMKAEAENILQQSEGMSTPVTVALRVEVVAIFLKALMNTAMSPDNGEFLKQVQSSCLQVYPRLMSSTNANRDPMDSNNFAKDVEKEVEYYYGRLYEGEMSIANFVEMLHSLKNSADIRDQDVFACMLHSLFDEYRFFADYPVTALKITAILFGSLIQNQLLAYIPLGIALRYILDAIGHEPETNMFKFGVQALSHFQDRVPSWPQYCQQVLAVPHLGEYEPALIAAIRNENQQTSHTRPSYDGEDVTARPSHGPTNSRLVFRSLSSGIDQRDTTFYHEPATDISDKILFNLNNLSLTNLSEKLEEVNSVLVEQYHTWFANHLVSQRAAVEPNYHSLYIHFLEAMHDEDLIQCVVQETIQNIALLLNSDDTITSTVERANLKNLGAWLGGLTLARNRPLKHRMISLKDLLLEGFDDNRLIVVLPFVCRVLEQTVASKVFKPPCPWTMAILALLVELYESADMKLNLKFEVEVLCKKLSLQMSEIPATSTLSNRPVLPIENDNLAEDLEELRLRDDNQNRGAPDIGTDLSTSAFVSAAIAELPLSIHPVIQENFAVPNLHRLLSLAAERAVQEFILPVVERSVAVASISTSQLVSKDFAMEEDVNKFRRAAHTMNQNLAGSLALVTCKEPLRGAFTNKLRILLAQAGFEGLSSEGETMLSQLISDNLDAACSIVEKAACERAVAEIDEGLAAGYQARRKHLEARNGTQFTDVNAPRVVFPLPDSLRIKPTGLTTEQMSTYDDFARVPRTAQEAAIYYTKEEPRTLSNGKDLPAYRNAQIPTYTFEQVLSALSQVDAEARESEASSIDELPNDSHLRSSLQQIPSFLSGLQGALRDERTLTCSQRVCQLLFKVPYHELAAQCLTLLLNHFVELSLKTFRDVSMWLVHSDDPRKFNVPVIQALMRAQIIIPSEFDVQLAKQVCDRKYPAIEFAIHLITETIIGSMPVALRSDFTSTLDALDNLAAEERTPDILELFNQLSVRAMPFDDEDEVSQDDHGIREQLSLLFLEWVHLISHPASTAKMQLAYILQLQKVGITTNDAITSLFFRSIIEQSLESASRMMPVATPTTTAHYLVLDAVAKLVVMMLKCSDDTNSGSTETNFERFLNIVVMLLHHEHDLAGIDFNQKPYFRLFASLLSELTANHNSLENGSQPYLLIICDALDTLNPSNFPGFAFSWITLISHRLFMPRLLNDNAESTWPRYSQLVRKLFQFIGPSLQEAEITNTTRVIYHALLRILLVLMNDFPGVLDEFHHDFISDVPDGCTQLRNLILSAFPRRMILPDPFQPGLKVDRLPETANAPRIRTDLEHILSSEKVLNHVHNYVYSMNPAMVSKIVRALVRRTESSTDDTPDTNLLNTLVLHCGVQAMASATGPPVFEVNSPWVSLIHELFKGFGPAGRYRLLGGIANQLRYPNSHTYFFSCVLLLLFCNGGDQEVLVKEQITRVLLERLICNRPHPWGLLITFTELLKNSKYGFWDLKFIRTSPEIETLFQSLFQHINQNSESNTEI